MISRPFPRHICCLLGLLICSSWSLLGQNSVGVRFFGLSVHPHGEAENASIMSLKFDREAYFVQNLGAILSYEQSIYRDIVLGKAAVGLYADCASQFAGFFHIGVRGRIFALGRHSLYGGLGPTLIFRRNWLRLSGYKDQKLFKGSANDAYQYLFLWYGGEFDYRYRLGERWDLALSFVPGYPDLISFSVGCNFRL